MPLHGQNSLIIGSKSSDEVQSEWPCQNLRERRGTSRQSVPLACREWIHEAARIRALGLEL